MVAGVDEWGQGDNTTDNQCGASDFRLLFAAWVCFIRLNFFAAGRIGIRKMDLLFADVVSL